MQSIKSSIKKVPYRDEEVENNSFYRDFLMFLKYIEENSPKLTQTGNLQLKSVAEINELLIRKAPMEEKVGNHIFRVRSEDEMQYIRTLDALAKVMKLSRKYKGRLRIIKKAKKLFDSLPPRIKFDSIWTAFLHYLNWGYLQRTENGEKISQILQDNQTLIWLLLRDFDIESNQSWISLNHTLEMIRKDFKIRWETNNGDDPDLARWGIEGVIFRNLLEVLDLVQIEKPSKRFKLTDLGRKVIRFQVSENGVGIPIENEPGMIEEDFKMPKWMECTWRRVPCGKDDCPICGRIKRDRQRHILKGEDPDSMEAVFEDVSRNFKEVKEMIKKDCQARGIELTNLEDIEEPPEPEEFPFYSKVKEWRDSVMRLGDMAQMLGEFWIHTEEAADLFWYANTLIAKVYRQLCNKWHIENGDEYGEFDYQYTQYVLAECCKILKKSLKILVDNYPQKKELNLIYSNFLELKKQVIKI